MLHLVLSLVKYVDDLLFSNPSWTQFGTVPNTVVENITALSDQIAWSASTKENITVLTSNSASVDNGVIQGLLYVPDLDDDDPCVNDTAAYVPTKAVRQGELPPADYNLIALAPWISGKCSESYLESAHTDPLRAFIFFIPDNSTSTPCRDSAVWAIHHGDGWEGSTGFPVYAVSGAFGGQMMYQLSLYSGNLSEVPHGGNISDMYKPNPDDYVRIWTELAISTPSSLPRIWVWILIIIAVFLLVVAACSGLMHCTYRRRRKALRGRVVAGEINLEAMGIKRLTVPHGHIKSFPLYTYHYEPEIASPASPTPAASDRPAEGGPPATRCLGGTGSVTSAPSARARTVAEKGLNSPSASSTAATDYQPDCVICLEPFENRVTVIRELSCGHIFHPECIDEFLYSSSSLCPVCKACVLPKGHCPEITNPMVRRERATRSLRGHVMVDEVDEGGTTSGGRRRSTDRSWWRSAMAPLGYFAKPLSTASSPGRSPHMQHACGEDQAATGMGDLPASKKTRSRATKRRPMGLHSRTPLGNLPGPAEAGRTRLTDLARVRMRQLAGSPLGDEGERGISGWRSLGRKIFPGF